MAISVLHSRFDKPKSGLFLTQFDKLFQSFLSFYVDPLHATPSAMFYVTRQEYVIPGDGEYLFNGLYNHYCCRYPDELIGVVGVQGCYSQVDDPGGLRPYPSAGQQYPLQSLL